MKRRGVCIGSEPRARKWRTEANDDAKSVGSNESLGEQLPSEEEDDIQLTEPTEILAPSSQHIEISNEPNPVVWLRFRVSDRLLRPLYIELFRDLYPRVAESILALCCGDLLVSGKRIGYAGSSLHKIIRGCLAMGGDLETQRPCFEDTLLDSPKLGHARAGLFCLARQGPDADGIQFCLTLGAAASRLVEGRYSVVGQVLGVGETGEEQALSPLRYLDLCGSSNGEPLEQIFIDSCGVSDAEEYATLQPLLAQGHLRGRETEHERFERAKFCYPQLLDVVSQDNAHEVMALVTKELEYFEGDAKMVDGEAQTSIEAGTATKVFHRCEQLEVGLTRLLKVLDEVDFRTLGEARASGKRLQQRVRSLGSKLAQSKSWSEEGETEAYVQRSGR